MAFTDTQVKSLEAKLNAKNVKTRQVEGTTLAYIEGWRAIAEANRIFGYDAWDRRTISWSCVWSGMAGAHHAAAYMAKVRVVVRAGGMTITREGCGTGEGKALGPGEAHEIALKGAETDATKRALATFGNPFGLALYDRELKGVRNAKSLERSNNWAHPSPARWELRTADGKIAQTYGIPEQFAEALKQCLSNADSIETLFNIWEQNVETVRAINRSTKRALPKTVEAKALVQHLKARAVALAEGCPSRGQDEPAEAVNGHASSSVPDGTDKPAKIDKSTLTIPGSKRIRCKKHLRHVAQQPCLICGRTPSHAHHVRYAQPRAMGAKVSDEYTVPLCAIHHTEIHHFGDERRWWEEHKIDPLDVAERLWREGTAQATAETTEPQ